MCTYYKMSIDFNLDWRWIFTDPEKFIVELNRLIVSNITYNTYTERAIEQYRNSCPIIDLDSIQFRESDVFLSWVKRVSEILNVEDAIEFTKKVYLH